MGDCMNLTFGDMELSYVNLPALESGDRGHEHDTVMFKIKEMSQEQTISRDGRRSSQKEPFF
jgi:hypothetical protein